MSASEPHAPASGSCENCATDLQGEYCHHCGQRAHNPLRSFWHSVEDVFESFWHLDGRVFRTLKELLIPGRVASAYLAGHRVPYLPPLRLFVILAVFAFFVAQFAFHPNINIGDQSSFANDTTVAQVEQRRDKTLAELAQARAELEKSRYARAGAAGFLAGEDAVRESAAQRIAELQGKPTADGDAAIADAGGDAIVETPTTVAWLPDVANRWLGHRIAMGKRNLIELKRNPEAFTRALIHSVPTALFVLVPVFALLLKLFYLRSGRGYLEHLVVALYSHAFLCLALLGVFVLQISGEYLPGGFVTLSGWLQALLWLWMAAYLWLTQLRVYAQGVFKTTLKYALLGSLYFWMVSFAAIILILLNLSRG